jgi:hypothetical protein
VARSAGGGSIDADVLFVIQAAKVGFPFRADRIPSAITLKFLQDMLNFQGVFLFFALERSLSGGRVPSTSVPIHRAGDQQILAVQACS